MTSMRLTKLLIEVGAEVERAERLFPAMNSPHEGWAVIREELDELWDLVRKDYGTGPQAREEAIQVAAMAVRYVLDLTTEVGA